jgi:hypothetical protein
MPYFPDLIPKEKCVLPDYFNRDTIKVIEGKPRTNIPLNFISLALFIIGIINIQHFWFGFIFVVIAAF